MTSKLNINKIESYSQAFAEKVCNEVFSDKKSLTGSELLKLTKIEQINYFILKNLFDKWTDEQQRLRSPYFNYESDAVKQALIDLANKLSNNILIERAFFKPLFVKAISESLQWTLSPQSFLESQFNNDLITDLLSLKNASKYFKINRVIIDRLILLLEQEGMIKPNKGSFFEKINEAVEQTNHSHSEPTYWLEQFGQVLSFELDDLISSIQQINTEKEAEKLVEVQEAAKLNNNQINTKPEIPFVFEEVDKIPVRTVLPPESLEPLENSNSSKILNDQFAKNNRTLNEMLNQYQNHASVNEQMARTKIHDLRSAISLNKRFQIINELFKGNTGEYLFAIEDIENSVSQADAFQILQEKFAHKYNWTFEDDLLKEFLQLIERRFL